MVGLHGLAYASGIKFTAQVVILDCLMPCKLLNLTTVHGEISRTMTQYGNKNNTRKLFPKVYVLSSGELQTVNHFYSLVSSKRDHFIVTLCETHSRTAHFRVPITAVVSKTKYNGIYV